MSDLLTLRYIPISQAELFDNNAKLHNLDQIIQSIARYGFKSACKWESTLNDGRGGIVAGNGRVEALREMERRGDDLPIGIAQDETGEWCVPVLFGVEAESEAIARAYALDDNNLTLLGGDFAIADLMKLYDPELLMSELGELARSGEIPVSIGETDLKELLNQLGQSGDDEPKPEYGEDDPTVPEGIQVREGVEIGSIWALGRHRIMCADSIVEANVRELLGDRQAVLIHADPPYGMGKEKDGVLNDNLYRDKLDSFQMKWWKACRGFVTDNASAYIWGNAEDLWRLWYSGGLKNSERLTFRNQVVWDKKYGQGMLTEEFRMYPTATEHCLFFVLGEQGFNNNADMFFDGWTEIFEWLQEQKGIMKWTNSNIHKILGVGDKGGGLASHYLGKSQWMLPTEPHYKKLQNAANGNAFKREYDDLKREYDDLKREWCSTRAYFDNTHENMTDVWEYPRVQGEERWSHATPKPVDMISRIYKSSSPDDGIIYSPFLGSGTDIIAAQKIEGDRAVYGMELSLEYIEIILQRWEKFANIPAKRIN